MIVLVDDDEIILTIYRAILQKSGYVVRTFNTATGAFDFLMDEDPELIISDISMPDMDGFEFRKRYNDRFPERSTPFLFITGYSKYRESFEAQGYASDAFMEKPVTGKALVAGVRSFVGH